MTGNETANPVKGKKSYREPGRIFESSGSVNPETSYYVLLENVTNTYKQDMKTMVDQGRYFSIFAPRQSGKTTFLLRFRDELHKDPTYVAILLSFQKYGKLSVLRFYSQVQASLYSQLTERLVFLDCDKTGEIRDYLDNHDLTDHISLFNLFEALNRIIRFKKIVIFIDEFDGIPLDGLEHFLTTLRDLYLKYKEVKEKALYSVGLLGIRNIAKLIVGGVSPFNIADQVDLPPFSLQNVSDLFAQYSEETNQPFSSDAVRMIHQETAGQPWLVNRLGTILTVDVKPGTTAPIDTGDVKQAIQSLLMERNDHFDNLYEKVKLHQETFIKIVFNNVRYNPDNDELTWLEQYGLIKKKESRAVVANNVYKQRYLETLFDETRVPQDISPPDYVLPGDKLDMEHALSDFEHYIAQIGVRAFYKAKKPYEKTGQFLLTAWLYQFVKGGAGDLRYEVASGLGRIDILLTFKGRKYIIETKVNHRNLTRTISDGMNQVFEKYLFPEFAQEGYLVVFDSGTPVGEERAPQYRDREGKRITCIIIGIGK